MQTRWLAIPAILIALYGGGLLYEEIAAPAGCCGLTWPNPDPIQTDRLLAQAGPRDRTPALRKAAALAVLAARPGEPVAWLHLAAADIEIANRVTPAAQQAIDNSYLTGPYGGYWAPTRIGLLLDHWAALQPATREQAIREIRLALTPLGPTTPGGIPNDMRAAAGIVRDPDGRLAAALLGMIP